MRLTKITTVIGAKFRGTTNNQAIAIQAALENEAEEYYRMLLQYQHEYQERVTGIPIVTTPAA